MNSSPSHPETSDRYRFRPTWAEVSQSAFLHNLRVVRDLVGPSVNVVPVLKANAYGHGSSLSLWSQEQGVSLVGVSSFEEGIGLRDAGLKIDILILGGVFPFENIGLIWKYGFIPTVSSLEGAIQLEKAAASQNKSKVSFHLKLDTGMGRLGVSVESLKWILDFIESHPRLFLAGVYSHFACADVDEAFTRRQLSLFSEAIAQVRSRSFRDVLFHISNSAGLLFGKEAYIDAVRPGLLLYGISPQQTSSAVSLKPVLSWKSQGIFLKRVFPGTSISYGRTYVASKMTDVMTVPVGYADGVPRIVSNVGYVLVQGQRCAIIGRVTMDHIMIDVSGLDVQVGEPVTLIGTQGSQSLDAWDWARWANTIPYEILCGISARVPREVVA